MLAASIALSVIAVALAWPVPIVVARASWPPNSPGLALVLWQLIALVGGFSMIGALALLALSPYPDPIAGMIAVVGLLAGRLVQSSVEAWSLVALAAAVLLTLHLLLTLAFTLARSELQRRRHAQLIALLGSPLPQSPDARLIDSPAPVAYCLPGALGSVTVFSAGLIALLDDEELQAVIEHERAHVRQRHDIVLVLFRAWRSALPWFPVATIAQNEVGLLIEMLADDRARRTVSDAVLARTIVLVGAGASAPGSTPGDDDGAERATPTAVHARVRRLLPAA